MFARGLHYARARIRQSPGAVFAHLLILGERDERAALQALANQLRAGADVRLAGYDHNRFRYMHRASVFALLSSFDGIRNLVPRAGCAIRRRGGACARGILNFLERQTETQRGCNIPVERKERKAIDDYGQIFGAG